MIDLRKPIIKRYHQHLIIRARRIQGSMSLSQRLIQDCVYGRNEVLTSYITHNYKPILMEMWEYESRKHMQQTLPNKLYQIGYGGYVAHTGKRGYIDFQIEMHKHMLKRFPKEPEPIIGPGMLEQIKLAETKKYTPLNKEELSKRLKELWNEWDK